MFINQQKKDRPPRPREQNALRGPSNNLEQYGDYEGHVAKTSLYTQAMMHPVRTSAIVLGAAGLALGWLRGRQND